MSDQSRAELLSALADLGQRYPHWRFGQLIANLADWADKEIWDVDDLQLMEVAQRHLKRFPAPETKPGGISAAIDEGTKPLSDGANQHSIG